MVSKQKWIFSKTYCSKIEDFPKNFIDFQHFDGPKIIDFAKDFLIEDFSDILGFEGRFFRFFKPVKKS